MYGLKRIIAIDSYVKGKFVPLEVEGHSCFNGFNAGGKTSSLKLVPFFYGAKPSDLAKKIGGKVSFINRYLPRPTSMLVYEYYRESGLCCVVVCRHKNSEKPVYRFLKAGYQRSHFSLDKNTKTFIEPDKLTTHWKSLDFDFSASAIEDIVKYRAIIQNNKALFARDKSIGQLASRFNCGSSKTTLVHTEKISLAILNQAGQFGKLREMIAEIMRSDNLSIPSIPSHKENKTIANQVKCLREFDIRTPKILELIKHSHRVEEITIKINDLTGTLTCALEDNVNKKKALNVELSKSEQALIELKEVWLALDLSLKQDINGHKALIESLTIEINSIQKTYDEYQNDSLLEKKHRLEQIADFEIERDEAAKRYSKLLENNKIELAEYTEKKSAIEKETLVANARNTNKISPLDNQRTHLVEQQSEALTVAAKKLDKEKDSHYKRHNALRGDLASDMYQAQAESKNVTRLETETLRLAAEKIEADNCEQSIAVQTTHVKKLQSVFDQIDQEHKAELKEVEHFDVKINQLEDSKSHLQSLLFPNDKSFLAALKNEGEPWHHLAKLLKTDVIQSTNLKPFFTKGDNSFYGWNIDTNLLPTNDICRSEEGVKIEFDQIEVQIDIADKQRDKKVKLVASIKAKVDEAELFLSQGKTQLNALIEKKDSLSQSYYGIEEDIRQAGLERREQASITAKQLTDSLAKMDDGSKKTIQQLAENSNTENNEIREGFNVQLIEIEEKKDLIQQDIVKQNNQCKEKLFELKKDFSALMKKNGVSDELLLEAQEAKDRAELDYQNVYHSKLLVDTYNHFIANTWPNLSKKVNQLNDQTSQLTCKNSEHDSADNQYGIKKSLIESTKREISTKKKELSDLSINIEDILRRYPDAQPIAKEDVSHMNIKQVISDLDGAILNITSLNKLVIKEVGETEKFINQYSDTEIARSWYLSCEKEAINLRVDTLDDLLAKEKPRLLDALIKDHLPQVRNALIATIRNVCNEINDFAIGLSQSDSHIEQQGAKISKSISCMETITDITDIRFNLTSKIKDADYWPSLKAFQKQRDTYVVEESNQLPTNQLIDSLELALTNLQRSRIDSDMHSLFDLEILVNEKGREVAIKCDDDLNGVSSKGLSYLLLCTIFIGLKEMLCKDSMVQLHWAMDELREIDSRNIDLLFNMLNKGNISMVAGFADPNPEILRLFDQRHQIDLKTGISMVNIPESKLETALRNREEMRKKKAQTKLESSDSKEIS